jgi:hypothetical protein
MKLEKQLPPDLQVLFDLPPEPRDLSGDWFDKLSKYEVSEEELTKWLQSLEDKPVDLTNAAN